MLNLEFGLVALFQIMYNAERYNAAMLVSSMLE